MNRSIHCFFQASASLERRLISLSPPRLFPTQAVLVVSVLGAKSAAVAACKRICPLGTAVLASTVPWP